MQSLFYLQILLLFLQMQPVLIHYSNHCHFLLYT